MYTAQRRGRKREKKFKEKYKAIDRLGCVHIITFHCFTFLDNSYSFYLSGRNSRKTTRMQIRCSFWWSAYKEDVSLFQFCDLNSSLVSWEIWSANMVCLAEPRWDWRGLWSPQIFYEFTETLWAWLFLVSVLCLWKFFFFCVTCFLKPFCTLQTF